MAILFLYFFSFNPFLLLFSSFVPTFFVLILSYVNGTCTLFFADISGRNFLSSFGHLWAELFSQVGVGVGCICTPLPPPPPPLRTRLQLSTWQMFRAFNTCHVSRPCFNDQYRVANFTFSTHNLCHTWRSVLWSTKDNWFRFICEISLSLHKKPVLW